MRKRRVKSQGIKSTNDRLRLRIFRSNKAIYGQVIDDRKGITILSSHSLKVKDSGSVLGAAEAGKALAVEAKKKKIEALIFDRGRYQYKGRVKAFADAVRENGIKI